MLILCFTLTLALSQSQSHLAPKLLRSSILHQKPDWRILAPQREPQPPVAQQEEDLAAPDSAGATAEVQREQRLQHLRSRRRSRRPPSAGRSDVAEPAGPSLAGVLGLAGDGQPRRTPAASQARRTPTRSSAPRKTFSRSTTAWEGSIPRRSCPRTPAPRTGRRAALRRQHVGVHGLRLRR